MAGKNLRMLVVGCGNMGSAHASAYHYLDGFEVCGLVSTGPSKVKLNEKLGGNYPLFDDYETALQKSNPDGVCIATYPDTHEAYAMAALQKGCHVFIEKPLADTVAGARRLAAAAKQYNKKLLVGYILRYHPSWQQFIEVSKSLGKPLVMRMNLNQQSAAAQWAVHLNLLKSVSPIVDCGVHYIDVMCQMAGSKPISVYAIGARLSEEVEKDNYNYGNLQIRFEDGSVGWYEAGWGPMMSETAFFIKDVIGPKGAVSIVAKDASSSGKSANIDSHTATESIKIHHSETQKDGNFAKPDEWLDLHDEPDHQELCNREQRFFLKAIEEDLDLSVPIYDAVNSLRIAFACDESVRTRQVVMLDTQ